MSALRWRHYDPTVRPLGKMLVAKSYNTRKNREKSTKTDAVDLTSKVPGVPGGVRQVDLHRVDDPYDSD